MYKWLVPALGQQIYSMRLGDVTVLFNKEASKTNGLYPNDTQVDMKERSLVKDGKT